MLEKVMTHNSNMYKPTNVQPTNAYTTAGAWKWKGSEDHHQDFSGTLPLFSLLQNLIIFSDSEDDSSDKTHSIICQGWQNSLQLHIPVSERRVNFTETFQEKKKRCCGTYHNLLTVSEVIFFFWCTA